MKKKTKKKVGRKEAPTPVPESQLRVVRIPHAPGQTFELFTVLVTGDHDYRCLVKSFISPNPHVTGHVIGEVVRMHAAIYEKVFKVEREIAAAMILEGVIHELEDTQFKTKDPEPILAKEYEQAEAIKRKKGLH
jgi:hypothetical protein